MLNNGAAGLVLSGGGTLQYVGTGASNTNRLFTLSDGGGTIDASGTGTVNFSNGGAMGIAAVGSVTLTLAGSNGGANTLAAVISDSGGNPTSLTKNGVVRGSSRAIAPTMAPPPSTAARSPSPTTPSAATGT